MKKTFPAALGAAILILSACSPGGALATPSPEATAIPTQAATAAPVDPPATGYPLPGETPDPNQAPPAWAPGETPVDESYPGPTQNGDLPLESEPGSVYPPVAGDAALQRGEFFIDQTAVQPAQDGQGFELVVEGSLPTPCHAPRTAIRPPDSANGIAVALYSVVDPGRVCAQVIEPFTGVVASFTDLPPGEYQVVVNGQPAGAFTAP
jgi:hypothetical protein